MPYGATIKGLREKSGLSQAALGARLGVTSQAVSKWETNKSSPDGEAIKELCKLYNVTANDILGIEDPDTDDGVWELRESLRRDPKRRMLFDAAANVSEKDIQTAVRLLDALKGSSEDGTD
mgnify:CR=1 FL=1